MIELYNDKKYCCGCMACADVCPTGAIYIKTDGEGFAYPEIDRNLCINCGKCNAVCPFKNQKPAEKPVIYFAAKSKDLKLRETSTSGAVFPVLANEIIGRGGTVCGAAFDDEMNVVHKRAQNYDRLDSLLRTKYVQSKTLGIYRQIQEDLKDGKTFLFSGMPCQAQALRLFAGESENLIILDTVCFGVPSPGVWQKYKKYLEKKYGGKLTAFRFRDKRRSNNGHTVSFIIDGKEYIQDDYGTNLFLSLYFGGYTLRPSCSVCPFSTVNRASDITIGDCWGIENAEPGFDDKMGISLVMPRTEKGDNLWQSVKDKFDVIEVKEQYILQPRLISPTPPAKCRSLFFALNRVLPLGAFALKEKIGKVRDGKK